MKKLRIQYGDGVLSLPREGILNSLPDANEFNLKVLLLVASADILHTDYDAVAKEVCGQLDCTASAFVRSLAFWQEMGVISITEGEGEEKTKSRKKKEYLQASELPAYTEGDAADIIEKNADLSGIIDICQKIVGKLFTPSEAQIVVGLYDHLRLDGEYIATLFAYCKDNGKKSLRYIEKTALGLYDEGIDTTQALNKHIKRLERHDELLSQIKSLIGAASRQLTSREKKLTEQWISTWRFDIDVITRAYEVTVDNIGDVKLPYMNRVLENWYNSGLTTLEAVEESLEVYKKNKAEAERDSSGFETNEYFEAALARAQRYLTENKS